MRRRVQHRRRKPRGAPRLRSAGWEIRALVPWDLYGTIVGRAAANISPVTYIGRMQALPFAKGHGLGNDYLVVERKDLPWPLTVERIRAICDRHHGIGSDGVMIADIDSDRFKLRIYNPDGSEAEKSGNG